MSSGEHNLSYIESLINKNSIDYIVISDYNKGLLSEQFIEKILSLAGDIPTFLDTKKILGSWSAKASVVKINNKEYNDNIKSLTESIHSFYKDYLIVTNGSLSTNIFHKNDRPIHVIPVDPCNVINVCGAGDSVLAGLSYSYSRTGDIVSAVKFANRCGTIACGYFGTHVFNSKDIEKLKEYNQEYNKV